MSVQWQLLFNTMKVLILIFCILHHIDGKYEVNSNSLDFEHHIVPRIKPSNKKLIKTLFYEK